MTTVAILGAHTAVGKAMAEVIQERDLDVDLIRATTTDTLEGDLDLIDETTYRRADLLVLTSALEAKTLAAAASQLRKPVVDLTGTFESDEDARLLWPGLDAEAGADLSPDVVSVVPVGLTVPLVSAIAPLMPLAPQRIFGCTLESAAAKEQPGMDELSAQVQAVFTMREAEPRVFPASLAFNAIPSLGEGADDTLAKIVRSGLEAQGYPADMGLTFTRIQVPTFSADSAVLDLTMAGTPDENEVAAALKAAPGIHLVDGDPPPALDAVGRDDVVVGRLQVAEGRIGLWLAADRLRRGSATLAALVLERWLEKA